MTERDNPFARPMAWWGAIQAGAAAHETTAQIWDRIHAQSAAAGLREPPDLFLLVNQLRSQGAGLAYASERLASAPESAALTSEYLAPLPYARSSVEQALVRNFFARVEYTAVRAGATEHSYITLPYSGTLPDTVGALYADAQLATDSLVGGYGAELVSVDRIEIGEW